MAKKFLILTSILLTTACTTSAVSNKNIDAMSCDEITHEIETLDVNIKTSAQNSEAARAADTGTSVAATGASMAGVPYIGGVVSIGKTLFRHSKQSAAIKAQAAQERAYALNDAAYSKGCHAY